MVKVKPGAKVITIEPARGASTIEWAVELFSTALEQVCAECFPPVRYKGAKGVRILAVRVVLKMRVYRRANRRS
jgi:hypothetical protein